MDVGEALHLAHIHPRINSPQAHAFHILAAEVERLRAMEARAQRVMTIKVANGWDVAAAHAARVILLGEDA